MKILQKLTKKNLLLNKKRTIVTIIGIILSTSLIVCCSGLVSSFQKTFVVDTIKSDGNYHVLIQNMNEFDALALKNNRNIKDIYYMKSIGYAKFNSKNLFKPFIYIESYDDLALNNMGINLTSGRLPKNDSEIIISNHLLNDGGLDLNLNDTITLDIGNRIVKEEGEIFILNQNNPYIKENDFDTNGKGYANEEFVNSFTKTYTIVGFMERLSYNKEEYTSPGYSCITYLDKLSGNLNAGILYKNPKNYKDKTKEIVSDKYDYEYNSELLRYLGVTDSPTMNALHTVESVVIGIIIVSSVFVIRNSFAISITEKKKSYGMLKSIGATNKQIKKNVLYEGFVLGLIAIPIGILCGILATYILCLTLNLILGDTLNELKFIFAIPIDGILLSTLLASLTIYLSVIFTALKTSKISPIDAIRSNEDIKIKSKKLKTPKIIDKLFKTGGVIAYKNLKRNKKKYRTTVISIVVSIFVFISLSSFIDMGFKSTNMYYVDLNYNVEIETLYELDINTQEEMLKNISKSSLIKNYSLQKEVQFQVDTKDYLSDFGKKIKNIYQSEGSDVLTIISVGEQEFERLLKKNNLSLDFNKGLLLDNYQEYIDKKLNEGELYNIKDNTTIKGMVYNQKDFSIEIINTSEKPMGLERLYLGNAYIIISDKLFKENFKSEFTRLYVDTDTPKELETEIQEMAKKEKIYKNINFHNIEEYVNAQKSIILIVSIFLYGFISVITLIGITNIFNTITTNMNLRSKEFAMLKSIGMTKKEFNRMIRLESCFYGIKSLIIGIPLGLIGSILIYKAFNDGLVFGYSLPIKAIIIVIIFVLIIIGIIMKYSLNKINKQNIIETIRNDNI